MSMLKKTLLITAFISTIIVNPTSKDIDKAGTYLVPFTYTDENGVTSEISKHVTITFPYTFINETIGEGIDANDIHIKKQDLSKLSNNELIELANAHAWDKNDGKEVKIENVYVHKNNLKVGADWKVTYQTSKNTEVSVDAYLSDNDIVIVDSKYINFESYRFFNPRSLFILLLFILVLPLIICSISFTYVSKKYRSTIELLFSKK